MKYLQVYIIIFGINMMIMFVVGMWMPDYRGYLAHEDSLVENLSAFFFLCTFFLGLLFILKGTKNKKALIFVSVIGLLGFLDEISFGERMFALNMPRVHGMPIDSAHDLFTLGYRLIEELAHSYSVLVYSLIGIGVILIAKLALKNKYEIAEIIKRIQNNQTYILALIFTLFIFAALIIDLDILHIKGIFIIEESLEMNAALALLFCSLSLYDQNYKKEVPI